MAYDMPESLLFDFIIGDFEAAWDALASSASAGYRGNFMFARQAVGLLELACRLCKDDASGRALDDLSGALEARDPRYFTMLPGPCWAPTARTRDAFDLPRRGAKPDNQVIAAVFNLIRNGQAHQYQQMRAVMADGKHFCISLTGAQHGATLAKTLSSAPTVQEHLSIKCDSAGDLWMSVRPDVLFLHIRNAIHDIGLLNRGLSLKFMTEDRAQTFDFTAAAAEAALRAGGH